MSSNDWSRRFEELETMRQLGPDWDGQGAEAPTPELLDNAVQMACLLKQSGADAPCCVLPGVNGTVIFEWQEDGSYLEIEVAEPDHANGFLIVPEHETEYWILPT